MKQIENVLTSPLQSKKLGRFAGANCERALAPYISAANEPPAIRRRQSETLADMKSLKLSALGQVGR